jgi:hypothetical protein
VLGSEGQRQHEGGGGPPAMAGPYGPPQFLHSARDQGSAPSRHDVAMHQGSKSQRGGLIGRVIGRPFLFSPVCREPGDLCGTLSLIRNKTVPVPCGTPPAMAGPNGPPAISPCRICPSSPRANLHGGSAVVPQRRGPIAIHGGVMDCISNFSARGLVATKLNRGD